MVTGFLHRRIGIDFEVGGQATLSTGNMDVVLLIVAIMTKM